MDHWIELHNLAARGSHGNLRPDNPPASIQPNCRSDVDARFTVKYTCKAEEQTHFETDDAVQAVEHVLRTGHTVHLTGTIRAVPVTVLNIPDDAVDLLHLEKRDHV